MQMRRLCHAEENYVVLGQVINLLVDVNSMVCQIPRTLHDEYTINGNIKCSFIHKSFVHNRPSGYSIWWNGPLPSKQGHHQHRDPGGNSHAQFDTAEKDAWQQRRSQPILDSDIVARQHTSVEQRSSSGRQESQTATEHSTIFTFGAT